MTVSPKNYTTSIATSTTVGEIQEMLASHGAHRVMIGYADRLPAEVSFELTTRVGRRAFTLPVNIDGMASVLDRFADGPSKGASKATLRSREHAARVAWRVLRDWLDAQLALVAASMADLDVVMLPYLVVDADGRTLAAQYAEVGLPALPAGAGSGA